MSLRYLDFDLSENADGIVTLDAMASVAPPHLGAVHAELALVLAWAHAEFPDGPLPIDEDGPWDYDLQATQERSTQERLRYDAATRRLSSEPFGAEALRHTVALSISATPVFAAAFCERFGVGVES